PVSLNRYAYANDNPTTFVDPDGHGIFDSIGDFLNDYVVDPVASAWDDVTSGFASVINWTSEQAGNVLSSAANVVSDVVTTPIRAIGNAVSWCAHSDTCRMVVVAVAVTALTVVTAGVGTAVFAAAVGAGVGLFTCHGDAACIAKSAITGEAFA